MEADERVRIPVPQVDQEETEGRYLMRCGSCKHEWRTDNPGTQYRCPVESCLSIRISGKLIEHGASKRETVDMSLLEQKIVEKVKPTYGTL